MKLKPIVLAVRQALIEIGEQWKRDQWYREYMLNRWTERGE